MIRQKRLYETLRDLILEHHETKQVLLELIIDEKLSYKEKELAIKLLEKTGLPIKKYLEQQAKLEESTKN